MVKLIRWPLRKMDRWVNFAGGVYMITLCEVSYIKLPARDFWPKFLDMNHFWVIVFAENSFWRESVCGQKPSVITQKRFGSKNDYLPNGDSWRIKL